MNGGFVNTAAFVLKSTSVGTQLITTFGPSYIDNVLGLKNISFSLGTPVAVSSIDTGTDTITATANGYSNGTPVQIQSTGAIPAGLAALTDYFVISATTNTLQLSVTEGGGAIDITGAGSGTITITSISRGYSALNLYRDNDPAPGCATFGVDRHGYGLYDNRVFVATNTTDSDPTHPAPDIVIAQHQGPASQQHARILFDGTNHNTFFYGWDLTNSNPLSPVAMMIPANGQLVVGASASLGSGSTMEVTGGLFVASGNFDVALVGQASYFAVHGGANQIFSYVPHVFQPIGTPGGPAEGTVYYNASTHHLALWNATAWGNFLTSLDSVAITADTGWTANADAGDKTKSIGTSASIATIATALNTLSAGSGSLLQAVAEKCKALETASVAAKLANA